MSSCKNQIKTDDSDNSCLLDKDVAKKGLD